MAIDLMGCSKYEGIGMATRPCIILYSIIVCVVGILSESVK